MEEKTKQQIMAGDYTPVGYSLTCPNCDRANTIYLGSIQDWLCLNCGIVFSQEDTIPCYVIQAYEQDERIAEELLELDNGISCVL